MNYSIYYNDVVLGIVILLMYSFCGMSLVSFSFNYNMILLIMIVVVSSIFTFVLYYIGGDVSSENFKMLKLVFLGLIIFILSSFGLLIFIG